MIRYPCRFRLPWPMLALFCLAASIGHAEVVPAIVTVEADSIARDILLVPAPIILAMHENQPIKHPPLTFSVGMWDDPRALIDTFEGCEVSRSGDGILTILPADLAGLLQGITLPQTPPSIAQSFTEATNTRLNAFNESQDEIFLLTTTVDMTKRVWIDRALIDLVNNEQVLLSYLAEFLRRRPGYGLRLTIMPLSEERITREFSQWIHAGHYKTLVLIGFAYFGYTTENGNAESYALRHHLITNRDDFAAFVAAPEFLADALLFDDPALSDSARIFISLYPDSSGLMGKAIRSQTDPVRWASVFTYSRLGADGRFESPESTRLFEVLTTHAERIDAGIATRGAEYLAFTSSPQASVYIRQVINRYATLDPKQTDAILRALILLPDDQRPEGLKGREDWLREMIARPQDEERLTRLRTAITPPDAATP